MRVFILPSWCPTAEQPVSGSFFVEQAHILAQMRPGWTVALCQFDLGRSRTPWRPWQLPRFVKDCLQTSRLERAQSASGLHTYTVWKPYLPRFGNRSKWEATAKALAEQARPALEDFMRRYGKPDLIHAHAVYPGGAAAVALGRAYGIAVGLTEHLGPFPPPTLCLPGGQPLPLVTNTYAGATLCSAVSQSLAQRIRQLGLRDAVTVIPNFLPDHFGSDTDTPPTQHERFSFLSVGGPSHAKGTDVLLKALARVDTKAHLCLVGSSPESTFFARMVEDLGLGHRVQCLGSVPREQMPALYRACDAFVLPSRSETFGMAFIEALAYGKPLVATRCGGPEDIVHAGNGLLVPPNSVEDLATALQHMMLHARDYTATTMRADFLTRFSASAVLERTEQWYRAVQSQGPVHVAL